MSHEKKYIKASAEDIRQQLKDEGVINPKDYKNEDDSIIVRFNYPINGFYYGMIDVVMDSDEVGGGYDSFEDLLEIVVPYLYVHRKELDCKVVYDSDDIYNMMTEDGFDYDNDDDYLEWLSGMELWDNGNGLFIDDRYCGDTYCSIQDFLYGNTHDFKQFA